MSGKSLKDGGVTAVAAALPPQEGLSPEAGSQAEPAAANAKTIAFTGETGDRFIFPSWIIYPDDPDAPSITNLWWQANGICSRTSGLKQETIEFDPEHFPHVEGSIGSSMFLHGSATVMFFAGPEFDSVAKAEAV